MGVDPGLLKGVAAFRRRVETSFPVDRLIVFGSRARGDARPDSDVDVLLVSPWFEGRSAVQRTVPVRRAWDLDLSVDFACYAPAEFEALRKRVGLVSVALAEGVEVAA